LYDFRNIYLAGAVAAGDGAVNSFAAFCPLLKMPQDNGTATSSQAAIIRIGEDFDASDIEISF